MSGFKTKLTEAGTGILDRLATGESVTTVTIDINPKPILGIIGMATLATILCVVVAKKL